MKRFGWRASLPADAIYYDCVNEHVEVGPDYKSDWSEEVFLDSLFRAD